MPLMALLQKPIRIAIAHNSQASNQSNLHFSRVYTFYALFRKEKKIYVGGLLYGADEKVLVTSIIGDGHRTYEHLWLCRDGHYYCLHFWGVELVSILSP